MRLTTIIIAVFAVLAAAPAAAHHTVHADDFDLEAVIDIALGGGVSDAAHLEAHVNGDTGINNVDLDHDGPLPAGAEGADVVTAVETIEHLENPRALVRQLVRLAKPGGWILLTTPNQRSVLSLVTLLLKGQFSAFQDTDYPAHITALLESDLRRIGSELGLTDAAIKYTGWGRLPLTS
ncbi:MAG TPA: methyltransferase domain-containing protein [Acidobacteria bacterium]|nr:methyltransferase domain-containing protein [Acidobacteriota bacterium]